MEKGERAFSYSQEMRLVSFWHIHDHGNIGSPSLVVFSLPSFFFGSVYVWCTPEYEHDCENMMY